MRLQGENVRSTITALKMKAGRSKRVVVHLDGKAAFSLAPVLAASLSVGQELDDGQITEFKRRQAREEAYHRALSLLGRRPRSERELEQYFKRRGFDEEIAAAVIERLCDQNLVDDHAFARAWIENRNEFRPRGPFALRAELRKKGVASDAIDAALEGFDQEKIAIKAANKMMRRWKDLSAEDFRSRLNSFLSRRGFDYQILPDVIAKIERERAGHEDESEEM
jgi:regulatory protein